MRTLTASLLLLAAVACAKTAPPVAPAAAGPSEDPAELDDELTLAPDALGQSVAGDTGDAFAMEEGDTGCVE